MKQSACLLLFTLLLLFFTSCGPAFGTFPREEPSPETLPIAPEATLPRMEEPSSAETEPPAPELPGLSFFLDDLSKNFQRLQSYTSDWIPGKDIGCFGVLPEGIEGERSYAGFWNRALEQYPQLSGYRLGYRLDFSVTQAGQTTPCTIRIFTPKDTVGDFNRYLEIYLYDDVHQIPGQFYSHLLESQYNSETLITSIKLTAADSVFSLSPITLSVFLYETSGGSGGGVTTEYALTTLPITKQN